MKTRFIGSLLTALLIGSTLTIRSGFGRDRLPAELTGAWSGNAQIVVVWCQQTNLQVHLQITPDGQVTGRIGDATLRNGRFGKNRGWLGRKLNVKSDYIITGNLGGPIVAEESISRHSVSIPLNLRGATFIGGLHTSGTHMGGKKSMVLSAAGLKLTRDRPAEPP